MRLRTAVFGCVFLWWTTQSVFGASLRFGPAVTEQANITLPILLTGGPDERISALDFRLRYDPLVFEPVSAAAGDAAIVAGKQVQASMTRPGEYVVVLMGINWTPLGFGEVAKVTVRKIADPSGGSTTVRMERTTFSTPEGEEAPSRGAEVLLQFAGAPNQPPTSTQSPAEPPSQGSSSLRPEAGEPAPRQGSSGTVLAGHDPLRHAKEPESDESAQFGAASPGQAVSVSAATNTDRATETAKLHEAIRRADLVRSGLPAKSLAVSAEREPPTQAVQGATPVFEGSSVTSRTDAAEPATASPSLDLPTTGDRKPDAAMPPVMGSLSQGSPVALYEPDNVPEGSPHRGGWISWKAAVALAFAGVAAAFITVRRRAVR